MLHSAGFLLVRKRADVPPSSLAQLSLSPCISFFLPGGWCYDWIDGPDEDARRLAGLTPDEYKSLMEEVRDGSGSAFGHESVIFERTRATELLQRFGRAGGFRLVEAALDEPDAESFVRMAAPPPTLAGYAPTGAGGFFDKLVKRKPVQPDGMLLGFEPLDYTVGTANPDCSLFCRESEGELAGVDAPLNATHLIDDLPTARRVCGDLEAAEQRARPGRWMPWAILDLPDEGKLKGAT